MKKRVIALIVTLVMMVGMLPLGVFAESEKTDSKDVNKQIEEIEEIIKDSLPDNVSETDSIQGVVSTIDQVSALFSKLSSLVDSEKLVELAACFVDRISQKISAGSIASTHLLEPIEEVDCMMTTGDSTVFGYDLEDCKDDPRYDEPSMPDHYRNTHGYRITSEYSYPALLRNLFGLKQLGKTKDDEKPTFAPLATARFRVEDIRCLVDPEYKGDGFTENNIIPMLEEYRYQLDEIMEETMAWLQREDLDFVVVGVGSNNFHTYLGNQLIDNENYWFNWDQFSEKKVIDYKNLIEAISNFVHIVTGEDVSLYQKAIESVVYTTASVMENIPTVVDKIHEINPNAKICLMGIYDPVNTLHYQIPGQSADVKLGTLIDALISRINKSYQACALERQDYCFYVDATDVAVLFQEDPQFIDEDVMNLYHLMDCVNYFIEQNTKTHQTVGGHEDLYHRILEAMQYHAHKLTYHEAIGPTCMTEGNIEYWTCDGCDGCQDQCRYPDGCGKIFADAEGKNEISDVVLPADPNAHHYGEWNKVDEKNYQRVCADCGKIEISEHAYVNAVSKQCKNSDQSVLTGLRNHSNVLVVTGLLLCLVLFCAVVLLKRNKMR